MTHPNGRAGRVLKPGFVSCPHCGTAQAIAPNKPEQPCFTCRRPMRLEFERGQAVKVRK